MDYKQESSTKQHHLVANSIYSKHQKIHDRPYKCTMCSQSFALKTDMKRHRKLHKAAQTEIPCPLRPCKFRGTNREDYFWRHLGKSHGGIVLSNEKRRTLYNEAKKKHTISQGEEQQLRLLEASYQGDNVLTTELLSEGVNVNTEDAERKTPLYLAAHAAHESTVRILLEKGANVNQGGAYYSSPLHAAASEGNEAIVKLLFESGADLNLASYPDGRALHRAVKKRHLAVVDLLLKIGAEVNVQTSWGETPLHLACSRNVNSDSTETVDGAIVRSLLRAGANIEAEVGYGLTPLFYATGRLGYSGEFFEEGVKLLLEAGARISPKDWEHLPIGLRNEYASQLVTV
jgi:hypothetical protein